MLNKLEERKSNYRHKFTLCDGTTTKVKLTSPTNKLLTVLKGYIPTHYKVMTLQQFNNNFIAKIKKAINTCDSIQDLDRMLLQARVQSDFLVNHHRFAISQYLVIDNNEWLEPATECNEQWYEKMIKDCNITHDDFKE